MAVACQPGLLYPDLPVLHIETVRVALITSRRPTRGIHEREVRVGQVHGLLQRVRPQTVPGEPLPVAGRILDRRTKLAISLHRRSADELVSPICVIVAVVLVVHSGVADGRYSPDIRHVGIDGVSVVRGLSGNGARQGVGAGTARYADVPPGAAVCAVVVVHA